MRRSCTAAAAGMLALVVGLAGCAGSTSPGQTSPSQTSSGQTGAGPEDVLTVWTFKQSQVAALEKMGEAWGAQNNMKVEVSVYTPDDAYVTKVQAAAKSGSLPDILSVHSANEDWLWAQAGLVQDITADFDDEWRSQFLPGVIEASTLTEERINNSGDDPTKTLKGLKAGNTYSIPFLAGTPGVVWASKAALTAAGVDPSTPPATWDDWIAAMEKTVAKDPENGGLVTGLQVPETGYFWLYRPLSYSYLGLDPFIGRQSRAQEPAWTSPDSIKTLELYDQLTPLWAPGVLSLGIDEADQAFASGKAAWDVGGTFTLASLTTFGMSPDDVTVFPVPAANGGVVPEINYQAGPLMSAAVTSTTKHREAAISFLKYWTSPEGAQTFAEVAGDLPATQIPLESLDSELMRSLVSLVKPAGAEKSFNPNDFSADPAGTIGHDTAVELAKLPAKSASVGEVASSLADLYKAAWAATK